MRSKPTGWGPKFGVAVNGLSRSVRTQSSFWVHLPVAVAVVVLAAWLRVELWRWASLAIVIFLVLATELINTSIEQLVAVLHPEQDSRIGHALDTAAAAVLVTSVGAVAVGLITLAPPLWQKLAG